MRFPWGFDEEDSGCRKMKIELAQQVMALRQRDVTQFLTACDCGVGLYAAEIVNGLRETTDQDLMLFCYTPHEEQATKWAPYLRERYFTMLEKCTHISVVCPVGTPDAQLQAYRFDTEENHLEEAVNQYNLFKSTPDRSKFKAISYDEEGKPYIDKKCKLIDIQKFYDAVDTSWIIDNFWSDEEKIELGFKKEVNIMTIPELQTFIDNVIEAMEEYRGDLECLI